MRIDLLDEPVLAPGWQIDLTFGRPVRHQVECLVELVAAHSDDSVWHVYEDASDILNLTQQLFLLNPLQLGLLILYIGC